MLINASNGGDQLNGLSWDILSCSAKFTSSPLEGDSSGTNSSRYVSTCFPVLGYNGSCTAEGTSCAGYEAVVGVLHDPANASHKACLCYLAPVGTNASEPCSMAPIKTRDLNASNNMQEYFGR